MSEQTSVKRRTKIIATLGPALDEESAMMGLIEAGVDVVRLNFSHGTHADHEQRLALLRRCAASKQRIVGVLADLQGPKIRIASFKAKKVMLEQGARFVLDADLDSDVGDETQVGIDYKALPQDVKAGDTLMLDDGRIVLEVQEVSGNQIVCIVVVGGYLSSHKGINRQGGGLSAKALTEKDKIDMQKALSMQVDYIAISFPRDASDIVEAKQLLKTYGGEHVGIVAKIERTEAMQHIEEIIQISDGVMVARGDLAVEIGDAEVPGAQKEIIDLARALDKPVITATQMMESMISSTIPTRAEVSDVANAVLDNTDAVMLSEETAAGKHPHLVVEAMSRVCLVAERHPQSHISGHRVECHFERVDEAIAMATMYTANHLDIKAISALTESGRTALWMSRIRTAIPIYALSRHQHTLGKVTLYRGVYPICFDATQFGRDQVNLASVDALVKAEQLCEGDKIILTKGDQAGVKGGSNAMKVLTVGDVA